MSGVNQPRALDLFCGAGGATRGLQMAGFHVTGVDINPQPRYVGDKFCQDNALTFPLEGYDFIWASPPCQAYSVASARWRNSGAKTYPDLLDPTRERIKTARCFYVIENVEGAGRRMKSPFRLCGQMFDIGVVRHRLFEANWFCLVPSHVRCAGAVQGPNGTYKAVTVAGHGGNSRTFKLAAWKEAMGIDWMTRHELTQSIPPAYSEFIGKQAVQCIQNLGVEGEEGEHVDNG